MSEILKGLLAEGKLRRHRTSPEEITDLVNLVERDMADACLEGLSADRRFAIAYEVAPKLGTITLYCKGYETGGYGHDFHTFQALRETMGQEGEGLADYFYKPQPMRSLDEIRADILALDKKTDGLLGQIVGEGVK